MQKNNTIGLVVYVVLSVLLAVVGGLMLFTTQELITSIVYEYSIYGLGGLFLLCGLYFIIKYFTKQEYYNLSNYGFTFGVVLIVAGILVVVNRLIIESYINMFLIITSLILGTTDFQYSLSMKHTRFNGYIGGIIVAVISVAGSILMLWDYMKWVSNKSNIYFGFLMTVGIFSLITLLLTFISLKRDNREKDKAAIRNLEDDPGKANIDNVTGDDVEDSVFETNSSNENND
ncbi:MAG: DUF308 domain-containing protein [Pseudobutyrivibrio sp.]|nr:DUF308 domain-containing protein [Pseudobutyrivibrio sp.]